MSSDLSDVVYEGIASMAARGWRALGVPLAVSPLETTIVDPEALILLTAWLTGEQDARVHSGALVWSITNHALINTVRLDNMASALPAAIAERFEPFAATVNAHAPHQRCGRPRRVRGATARPRGARFARRRRLG